MPASDSSREGTPGGEPSAAAPADSSTAPVVTINDGAVRGAVVPGGYSFLGLPYAAPPTGNLRWRPPLPAAGWPGVRDGTKLAANGIVVVTINHRLGAFGFLAHPALASHPGGPSGNYGLMDQQAALRWVQDNIGRFGGDPDNVTIAGQSSGGLSALAHMVSRSRASSTARCSKSRSGRRWPPGGPPACRSSTGSTTMRSGFSSPQPKPSTTATSFRCPSR